MLFKFIASILVVGLLVSCGSSNTTGKNATKAAGALSSAFNSSSRDLMIQKVEQELRTQAWATQFRVAAMREDMPSFTLSCDLFTSTNFCSRGQQGLEDANGATVVTCSQSASGDTCDTTCDGTGQTVSVPCGSEKVSMADLKMTAGMTKPSCTDDGNNLEMTFCMVFKEMSAKMTYNGTTGTLACGNADGSQKMCMTMKFPKTLSEAGAGADNSAPSQDSNLSCTLDGAAVAMDFAGGTCTKSARKAAL